MEGKASNDRTQQQSQQNVAFRPKKFSGNLCTIEKVKYYVSNS